MIDEYLQVEAAFLGSMIINSELIDECYIQPYELAADPKHEVLLKYIKYAYELNGKIDMVILTQTALDDGTDLSKVGGLQYMSQLTSSVPAQVNFDEYQAFIRENYIERQLKFRASSTVVSEQGGAKQKLADMQKHLDELQEMLPKKRSSQLVSIGDLLNGHATEVLERHERDEKVETPTLSSDLDRLTAGHHKQDLEIVAARPSVGKTVVLINDALKVTKDKETAAIVFSLEMSSLKMLDRFVCSFAMIDASRLRIGNLNVEEWEKYHNAHKILSKRHIYIDDTPGITIEEIKRQTKRKIKELKKIGIKTIVIYIDYLQLIQSERRFQQDNQRTGYVSTSLKQLAREMDATVMALSQLSRKVEDRQDKRPMLSDLRESGQIEQDADVVILLYRDDYYNRESEKKNILELILAKQRNGPVGTVEVALLKECGRISDLNRKHGDAS